MQIQRYDNISYKGLTKKLGKSIYNANNIHRLQDFYATSNPNSIVGNLPHQWVKNMPRENLAENIKQFYTQIGELIQNLVDVEQFEIELNKLLKNFNAINKEDFVQVTQEAIGAFGKCYKIQSNNPEQQPLLLKQFKKWTYHGYDWMYKHRHGAECEINSKIYIKSNLKKNEDKALFSKFHYGDLKHKYYVENYVKSLYNREQEAELIYSNKKFIDNCIEKIMRTLAKLNLCHCDLNPGNLMYYANKKGTICPKCCDLGGVRSL